VTSVGSLLSKFCAIEQRPLSDPSPQICPQLRRQLMYGAGAPRAVQRRTNVSPTLT